MNYSIGSFVGGVLIVWLLSLLIYRFSGAETPKQPVLIAYLVASTLASFGMMDGGSWHWQAYFYYLPSAAVVLAYMLWRERRAEPAEDLGDIFD